MQHVAIRNIALTTMGWLIVGMSFNQVPAAQAAQASSAEATRLEQLLALHDVRTALHASRASERKCGEDVQR